MLITDRYSSFAHTLSRVVFATTLALGCAACASAGSETAAETDAASGSTEADALTGSGPINPQLNTQLCLDVSGGSQNNGTLVQIARCSGNDAQKWTYTNKTLRVFSNKCLSVVGGQDSDGTKLQIWDCVANDPAESFTFTNNQFQWTNKTRCIDIPYGQATDGMQMQIVTCGANNSAQKWNMATATSTTTTTTTTSTTSTAGKYTNLVWSDDFHAMTAIDTSKWNVEVTCAPNNNELECYTASQSNVVGDGAGNLLIKVAKVSGLANGRSYTSGRINTQNKGDWTYGRFEMRAKMPKGQGFWPAFWMMPTTSAYGAWPTSGELDITEVLGSTTTTSYGTAHYGLPSPYTQSQGIYNGADLSSAFHIYALERDAHQVRWYLDGVLFYTLNDTDKSFWPAGYTPSDGTPWPFTQKFYIIINVAMGGDWPGTPDPSITSGEMMIDYVRVYQ